MENNQTTRPRTPTSQAPHNSGIQSTSPRFPCTDGDDYNISCLRNQIVLEMKGEFVICPVNLFFEHYMPFKRRDEFVNSFIAANLPQEEGAEATVANVVDNHTTQTRSQTRSRGSSSDPAKTKDNQNTILKDESGQLRFSAYRDSPSGSIGSEDWSYKALADIAQAIGNFKPPEHQRNRFSYRHCPHQKIGCDVGESIDACFAHVSTDDTLSVAEIAVPTEQKLNKADKCQNNKQVVSMNLQIMNDDVRRMFTFGVTFESDEVTLWYHSRSHSAVSESFSFVEDPELLVKVFASFLFATDEELGYNPRIRRHADGSYTYKFEEPDRDTRYFRTKRPLAAYQSNNITGRTTRVWLAVEVTSSTAEIDRKHGKEVALKDVWLNHDAVTERQLQEEIFKDIEAFWSSPSKVPDKLDWLYKKHANVVKNGDFKKKFLKILTDFTGHTSQSTAAGAKRTTNIFDTEVATPTAIISNTSGLSDPLPSNESHHQDIHRTFPRKKHYCVVFEEVCTTVGNLDTMGKVVDVLSAVLIPLQLMFCAGWVHRDISCGNVMAYKASKTGVLQVKLADLEYAKKFPGPENVAAAVDPKTGTPYFMPVEILQQELLFRPHQESALSSDPTQSLSLVKLKENSDSQATPARQVVLHNFQHDLESVWWILLWTITDRIQHKPSLEFAHAIFQNTLNLSRERRLCFTDGWKGQNFEKSVQVIARDINFLRKIMHDEYILRARDNTLRNVESYTNIHKQFIELFAGLQESRDTWNMTSLVVKQTASEIVDTAPSVNTPLRVQPKRKLSDDSLVEAFGPPKIKQGKQSKNN